MKNEGAKNVSWPWLSPFRGWGSLTMAFTGKFVYILYYILYIYYIYYIYIIYIYIHIYYHIVKETYFYTLSLHHYTPA